MKVKLSAEDKIFGDLAVTARDRVRDNIGLTIQLLDGDDEAIAALLMVIAADLLNGAAHHAHRAGKADSMEEAFGHVLLSIIDANPRLSSAIEKKGKRKKR